MRMHSLGSLGFVAAMLSVPLLAGCSSGSAPGIGGAELRLYALNAADVGSATVTVTGPGIDTPIVIEMVLSADQWVGSASEIPAGDNRTFTLSVLDHEGVEIYQGQVTGVTITAGESASVGIGGQQSNPSPTLENSVPVMDSLVASSVTTAPTDQVLLVATAHDPDPADVLTYAWTATGGTFSSTTTATTSWQPPATAGSYRLTVTASDSTGATASMWADVTVTAGAGEAVIAVEVNNWPTVTSLTSTQSRIGVGDSTSLAATASDPDDDDLSYSWSTSCVGTFSATDVASPTFTLAALPETELCRFTVIASDGRGGTGSGNLTIAAAAPPPLNVAPQITSATVSPDVATPGATVTLQVQANDPENGTLSFAWSASIGTLGSPTTDANGSYVVWTAPVEFGTTAHITVTITDSGNATTERVFNVAPMIE